MTAPRRAVDLSPRALLVAGVSGVLAADLGAATARTWTIGAPVELQPRDGGLVNGVWNRDLRYDERRGPVAIVRVHGPLEQRATFHDPCGGVTDGYDAIEVRFVAALSDVDARAVVLVIDSPGGDAAGLMPAVARMRAAADRARKPVWSVADEWATSAAYALLAVGDRGRVHVPRQGRTASIGTVIVRREDEDADRVEVFRSGERKMRPNAVEPLDDTDRAELQQMVDARALDFAEWVSVRRGESAEHWLSLKGASMSGESALAAGLVDGCLTVHELSPSSPAAPAWTAPPTIAAPPGASLALAPYHAARARELGTAEADYRRHFGPMCLVSPAEGLNAAGRSEAAARGVEPAAFAQRAFHRRADRVRYLTPDLHP